MNNRPPPLSREVIDQDLQIMRATLSVLLQDIRHISSQAADSVQNAVVQLDQAGFLADRAHGLRVHLGLRLEVLHLRHQRVACLSVWREQRFGLRFPGTQILELDAQQFIDV